MVTWFWIKKGEIHVNSMISGRYIYSSMGS
jgi:predicted site-specific integrase-resolvase